MNVLCFYFNVLRYLNVLVSSCVLSVCVSTSDVWNKIVSLPPLTRRCHVLLLINHLLRLHYSLLLSAHLPLIHLLLLLHRSPPAAQHKHSSALPPAVCLVLLEACFSSLPPHPLVHPSEFYVGCITFRSFILNLLLLVFSDKTGDGHKIMGGRANEDPMILCPSPVFPLVPISLSVRSIWVKNTDSLHSGQLFSLLFPQSTTPGSLRRPDGETCPLKNTLLSIHIPFFCFI